MAQLCWLLLGGLGGNGSLGGTMANSAVLLSGAEPSPQTEDSSSCRTWAAAAGHRHRLPRNVPSPLTSCSHCWISAGAGDMSPSPSHPSPGCQASHRGCRGCLSPRQHRENRGSGCANASGCVREVPGWESPGAEHHGAQQEGGIEAVCHRAGRTADRSAFRTAPGGRWSLQVAAWVSWGGPEPCQVSVPSALGCHVPGWARSHGQSDPGAASLSRGRSVALDMEDGSLPCCPCAWHGMERWMLLRPLQIWTGLVLDWDWMRTGLGLAWDRTGKWQHFRCSRGSTVSPSAEPAVL